MTNYPPNHGAKSARIPGFRLVSRAMVHRRASELALIAARATPQVFQVDYEQAKRELTGESDIDRQNMILDCIPEQEPGGTEAGATSYEMPGALGEHGGDRGPSDGQRLAQRSG